MFFDVFIDGASPEFIAVWHLPVDTPEPENVHAGRHKERPEGRPRERRTGTFRL